MPTPAEPSKASETRLADKLRDLMKGRSLSMRALGRLSGVDHGTISRISSGQQTALELGTAKKLARALNVSVGELVGEADVVPAEDQGPIRMVSLDQLTRSALNPRLDPGSEDALKQLAESIAASGLLQNLIVSPGKPGRYAVVAGGRRLSALEMLAEQNRWDPQAPNIPCRVMEADKPELFATALIENLQREELPPLDEAEAYRMLKDDIGWTTEKIAETVGLTQRHVQLRLALIEKLGASAKKALATGEITLSMARALSSAPEADQSRALPLIQRSEPGWRSAEDIAEGLGFWKRARESATEKAGQSNLHKAWGPSTSSGRGAEHPDTASSPPKAEPKPAPQQPAQKARQTAEPSRPIWIDEFKHHSLKVLGFVWRGATDMIFPIEIILYDPETKREATFDLKNDSKKPDEATS